KSYDPFGKPRKGNLESVEPPTLRDVAYQSGFISEPDDLKLETRRGFTDHEHLDDAQLIHMNGRIYDYNAGRFLSVDPFIQSPGNSQSMNPYSYIMNNPLSGTDPSGYYSVTCHGAGCGAASPEAQSRVKVTDKNGNTLWTGSIDKLKGSHTPNTDLPSGTGGNFSILNTDVDKWFDGVVKNAVESISGDVSSRDFEGTSEANVNAATGNPTVATPAISGGNIAKAVSKSLLKGGPVASAIIGVVTPSDAAVATMSEADKKEWAESRARAEEMISTARQADGAVVLFHGTSYESGVAILGGAPLSAEFASKLKYPSEVDISDIGFYLTPDPDVAFMFAARRKDPVILQFTFTKTAFNNVMNSGGTIRPIPAGKLPASPGIEVVLFPQSYPMFNAERGAGQILVNGANY
ncbi:RHS repeat domain-containing protein, partial [Aliikangiella coralliicola]|uniref:RHS repeat domain-containing protein n=1 Tax=Aliikangiella coralliicola TaxID=2592383 RepID=UPI001AF01FAF